MILAPGDRIGSYEIIGLLDAGGQGEVYRARDSQLSRDVALKVLRGDQMDGQQRARFEREARSLAALNHPNIATIHGIEDGDGLRAIVMELVEGQSLAATLARGGRSALPVNEALRIAAQIAVALEAAHERGIVHRDLKPANVMVRPDGTVKVLDFGLAKSPKDHGAAISTMTAAGTGVAVIGTAAYMSPEQARGGEVDQRTDVWAFGCVLYEMLTGVRAFDGATASDAISAVLTREPDFDSLPPLLDQSVRRLLRRCLQKDVRSRLRDIVDARFAIDDASAAHMDGAAGATPAPASRASARSVALRRVSIAAGMLALVAVAWFTPGRFVRGEPTADSPMAIRLSTTLPGGVSVTRGPGYTSSVAVSPDGGTIVIAASDADGQRLYRRTLDRFEATPIAGSEGGSSPFFSWDGKWIGYFALGRLKRIPAAGGAPVDIADAAGFPGGASWGPDDRIVFAYGNGLHLQVVAAEGGPVEPLTTDIPGSHPNVLPDGRTVLFESSGEIHAYDRQSRVITKVVAGVGPRYSNGYVVFTRGATLLAAPFDVDSKSIGPAVAVTERVAVELPGSGGGRHYAISRSGTLVYVPAADAYHLVVVGGDGEERVIGQPQRSFENPRFSPDGRRVVVATRRSDDAATDLWVHDLGTGAASRVTSHGGRAPVWVDDTTISYSRIGEPQGIYTARADGGAASTELLPLKAFHWLVGWTPDRSTLLYGQILEGNRSSIMAYANLRSRTIVEPASIWGGRLSRDGKWLAYYVLNSGTFEVYVTPYPDGGARWLIGEGTDPSWAPDGRELFYRSGPRLLAADLAKSERIEVLTRRIVVDPFLPPLYDDYDIHPDGRTLVLVRPANPAYGREVMTVVGWFNEVGSSSRQ